MNLWLYFVLPGGVILFVLSAYLLLVWYDAKRDTKNAPREDMIDCHTGKHGPYPKRCAMMVSDLGTEHPVPLCPICFTEASKKARANLGLS